MSPDGWSSRYSIFSCALSVSVVHDGSGLRQQPSRPPHCNADGNAARIVSAGLTRVHFDILANGHRGCFTDTNELYVVTLPH